MKESVCNVIRIQDAHSSSNASFEKDILEFALPERHFNRQENTDAFSEQVSQTPNLGVVIRSTGEATFNTLVEQVWIQMKANDELAILSDNESFEKKLRRSLKEGLRLDRDFSVVIDADILIGKGTLKFVRSIINKLKDSDLGAGLLLLDRFYHQPKFRGFHVYNNKWLKKAIESLPEEGEFLRPEATMKERLEKFGHKWRNDLTSRVIGLHDYFQSPFDIYYKYLMRSHRSVDDISLLESKFKAEGGRSWEFRLALQGIEDGRKLSRVVNNKALYFDKFQAQHAANYPYSHSTLSLSKVNLMFYTELFRHIKSKRRLFNAIAGR